MIAPRRSRIGTAFRARALGLLSALAVAAAASLTAPTTAIATPATFTVVTYTFSGAQASFYGANFNFLGTDTFTGTFTLDFAIPGATLLISSDITASGPVFPGFYARPIDASLFEILVSDGTNNFGFFFGHEFDTPIDFPVFNTPDPLINVDCSFCGAPNSIGTGVAIPSIPEPASLALLGGALGLFLFARRLSRRACQA